MGSRAQDGSDVGETLLAYYRDVKLIQNQQYRKAHEAREIRGKRARRRTGFEYRPRKRLRKQVRKQLHEKTSLKTSLKKTPADPNNSRDDVHSLTHPTIVGLLDPATLREMRDFGGEESGEPVELEEPVGPVQGQSVGTRVATHLHARKREKYEEVEEVPGEATEGENVERAGDSSGAWPESPEGELEKQGVVELHD